MKSISSQLLLTTKLLFTVFSVLYIVLISFFIGILISANVSAAEFADHEPQIYALDTLPAIEVQSVEAEDIKMPASAGLVDLLRSTLLMVNVGNQSGDYSLLYSNLTPPVKKNVDVDQLAQALVGFREEKVDMSAVSIVDPQFVKTPSIDANGVLNLKGYFPTQPRMLRFNLDYRQLDGSWRLEMIDLDSPSNPELLTPTISNNAKPVNQVYDEIDMLKDPSQINVYTEPPITTKW